MSCTRLNELKANAVLNTLHAKINPRFLYNALNSIAEFTVTDGRKASSMTLGLADLFRDSINFNDSIMRP